MHLSQILTFFDYFEYLTFFDFRRILTVSKGKNDPEDAQQKNKWPGLDPASKEDVP